MTSTSQATSIYVAFLDNTSTAIPSQICLRARIRDATKWSYNGKDDVSDNAHDEQ